MESVSILRFLINRGLPAFHFILGGCLGFCVKNHGILMN